MSFSNAIVEAGVVGLAALYRGRALTPTEVTEVYLSRIEGLDGALNSFLHVDGAGARRAAAESAARWSRGDAVSRLDGVPIAVKANIAVRGLPWHAGVGAYRDRLAPADAAVVAALRASGAVVLGSLSMDEGALGGGVPNPVFGACANPHRLDCSPGGSSGGPAAAAAAGLCAAALGTDTLGSVRIPSGYCGVFGHKPALGSISTVGVVPLSWSLDAVGLLARSTADVSALLAACREADDPPGIAWDSRLRDARLRDARPWAVLEFDGQVDLQPSVQAALGHALEAARRAGLRLDPLRLADDDYGALRRAGLLVCEVEAAVEHAEAMERDPTGFSSRLTSLLAWGARQPAPRLARAYGDLSRAGRAIRALLEPYAGLLSPTTAQTAFALGGEAPANQAEFTVLGNVTGLPATAFPVGLDTSALPISLQALGWRDASTLDFADTLAKPLDTPAAFRA